MRVDVVRVTGFSIILLLILSISAAVNVGGQQENQTQLVAKRQAEINVRVVLAGIDSEYVLQDYLLWNSPQQRYQLTVIPGISTETTYSVKYDFALAPSSFLDDFSQYLRSAGKKETRVNVLWNETYGTIEGGYFLNYTHYPVNATNTYYPADQVESWLQGHQSEFGGLAENGYTLLIADLSEQLPSMTPSQFEALSHMKQVELTPHFYNKTYADHDLGIKLNRRYMTAWGGQSRFFFIDISAGPGHAAEQLPIQLAAYINHLEPTNSYWSTWLTQYLADYIWGAVYNLFLPDFVYPLNYAQQYSVRVFVFDNRSSNQPPIESTVDPSEISRQLSSLLPFAKLEVDVQFLRPSDNPDLAGVIRTSTSPSLVGISPIVDARPVYEWLSPSGRGHITDFTDTTRNSRNYDIPVFVFAFDGNYTFGFTYKELVAANEADFDRTIWGVALYDLVLISHSADDLQRGEFTTPKQPGLGFGFTNTIIHEVGHMVALMHPFHTSYDPTENFVASVMAYYPYEDSFSQFDKDVLQRGYADELIRGTRELLASTTFTINPQDQDTANEKLGDAEVAYTRMNYTQAAVDAYDAYVSASRASLQGGGVRLSGLTAILGAGGASFVLGLLVMFFVARRRKQGLLAQRTARSGKCSLCGSRLTWIQEYQRWYCYSCKRYE